MMSILKRVFRLNNLLLLALIIWMAGFSVPSSHGLAYAFCYLCPLYTLIIVGMLFDLMGEKNSSLISCTIAIFCYSGFLLWLLDETTIAANVLYSISCVCLMIWNGIRIQRKIVAQKAQSEDVKHKDKCSKIIEPLHFYEVAIDIDELLKEKIALSAFIYKYGYFFSDELFWPVILNHKEELNEAVTQFNERLGDDIDVFSFYEEDRRKMYNNWEELPPFYKVGDDGPMLVIND